MTIRAEIASRRLAGAPVLAMPKAHPRPLAEGFVAPLADRTLAVFFDEKPAGGARRRLAVEADGAPVPGPLVSTALSLRSGGRRHVVLLGHPADWLARRRLLLGLGGIPAAVVDPEWLQSPRVDVGALFEGLTDDGRQRLLRLLLTTGASLLGRGASGLGGAMRDLLALLGVRRSEPLGWCRIGATARIVSYRLPAGFDCGRLGPPVLLTGAKVARLADRPFAVEPRREDMLVHVVVAGAPKDSVLVTTGPEPIVLGLPADQGALAIERWFAARDAATRSWCGALIEAAASDDPLAHAILRELRHRDAPRPALAVDHLSGTPAGVLHAFRLVDPHGLVGAVQIARGSAHATLALDGGGALAGYAALPRASSIEDRCRLSLVLHSGRTLAVSDGSLPAFDGGVPAAIGAPALAAARLDRERAGRILRTETFGEPASAPAFSVICPVADCPDVIATRAALAAAEPGGREIELLYHAPEGTTAEAARVLLGRAAATYGLAHRLLVVTPDLEPAARVAAGVTAARAKRVLVFAAEVLPAGPDWLRPWRRLSRRHPMLRAAVESYEGRRLPEAADCLGLLRDAAVEAFAAATPYASPAVLAAQAAAFLAGRGTPEARLGLVFRRYGDGSLTAFEKSVEEAVLDLILKRSFSFACDQRVP